MDITIKQGEGISQALKRQLMTEYQVKGKQFNQDVWKKIQTALNDGKSTLTNKKAGTKLIGDLWKPDTKNVSTRVDDVISIDDSTFKEILGFFGAAETVKSLPAAGEAKIVPAPVVSEPAASVSKTKTQEQIEPQPAPVFTDNKLKVETNNADKPVKTTMPETKEEAPEIKSKAVPQPEAPDLETTILNEKKALTQSIRNIKHHDTAVLMYKATDVLVDVANMEDKPDVEFGQESDYSYQISSLSNNRAIEVRTYEDGHRSVHVTFDKMDDKTKYLFNFEGAEVVYDIGNDGKTTMRIINSYGQDDSEEVDSVEIQQNEFNKTLDGLIKKIFCE